MQIVSNLLRVIFMLSTIVYVTDCCSSRILLLEEHTLKFVRQRYQQYQHQNQQQHQQHQEYISSMATARSKLLPKHSPHVDSNIHIKRGEAKKNVSSSPELSSKGDFVEEDDEENSTMDGIEAIQDMTLPPIEQQLLMAETDNENATTIEYFDVTESTATEVVNDQEEAVTLNANDDEVSILETTNNSELTPSSTPTHEQSAGNRKFHVIDIYYTIMRDVLSYECFGQFRTDFCLNGGRCFRFPIGNESFYSCECADDYVGERCESKSINGLFIPSSAVLAKDVNRPKILTARIVFSYPSLLVVSTLYILIAAILVFKKRASGMLVVDRIDTLDSM